MEQAKTPSTIIGGKVTCAECGKLFSKDEILTFGKYSICADCKPVFQQKLSEGTFTLGTMRFGSVGRRFVALLIDAALTWIFMAIGIFIITLFSGKGFLVIMKSGWLSLISTAAGVGYDVYFIGKFGATLGKMGMGLKVVRANGTSFGYGLAFGRHIAKYLNVFTFGIGYLIAVWDKEKRALHDRVCGTRVIHN